MRQARLGRAAAPTRVSGDAEMILPEKKGMGSLHAIALAAQAVEPTYLLIEVEQFWLSAVTPGP